MTAEEARKILNEVYPPADVDQYIKDVLESNPDAKDDWHDGEPAWQDVQKCISEAKYYFDYILPKKRLTQ